MHITKCEARSKCSNCEEASNQSCDNDHAFLRGATGRRCQPDLRGDCRRCLQRLETFPRPKLNQDASDRLVARQRVGKRRPAGPKVWIELASTEGETATAPQRADRLRPGRTCGAWGPGVGGRSLLHHLPREKRRIECLQRASRRGRRKCEARDVRCASSRGRFIKTWGRSTTAVPTCRHSLVPRRSLLGSGAYPSGTY